MTDVRYSLVVAMLLVGGLIGALSASHYSDKYGRRQTLVYTNGFVCVGSLVMTLAPNGILFMAGRFLVGLGAGMVTVVVPTYIAECAPKSTRGLFGTLNQLAIVAGILVSQLTGISLPVAWRGIFLVGAVLSVFQLCLLPFCVDSPRYLATSRQQQAKQALLRLRGPPLEDVEEEIEGWRRGMMDSASSSGSGKVTLWQFLVSAQHRHPLLLILLLQLSQQLSGINAVIFYSTSIMSTVFPESSDRITVCVSMINLLMTLVSAYFMDKTGRRTLFLISSSSMACCSILLGWSIQYGYDRTSAFAITVFTAAFATGLGPIPSLMIPELVETSTVASAGSVGLASNMITNFVVSSGFMALRDTIGQGQVFYVFATFLVISTCLAFFYLPETKNKSADQIVQSRWTVSSWESTKQQQYSLISVSNSIQ
ncbi:general substrate transporter [Chlamydoabsidia padenii]|nr:general substrate transporter [Chlamydoabsidia padenii]